MPTASPSTVSILPSGQSSPGSIKSEALALTNAAKSADPIALLGSAGRALASVQSQIDQIVSALRAPIPQPPVIQILDPSGKLIAEIGNLVDGSNVNYPGIWAVSVWIGGTGPATAPFVCDANGNLTITGSFSASSITSTGATGTVKIIAGVLTVTSPGGSPELVVTLDDLLDATVGMIALDAAYASTSQHVRVAKTGFLVLGSGGTYVVQLSGIGDSGTLVLNQGVANSILAQAAFPRILVFDAVNSTTINSSSTVISNGTVTITLDPANFITIAFGGSTVARYANLVGNSSGAQVNAVGQSASVSASLIAGATQAELFLSNASHTTELFAGGLAGSATATGGVAIPATCEGFVTIKIDGTSYLLPAFHV